MKNQNTTLNTPKRRFPEFENAGVWEMKPLGEILKSVKNGLTVNQENEKSGFKVTRIETISNRTIDLTKVGYIKTEMDISESKLAIGDILLSNINSLSHIGKVVFVDKDYDLYHGMNLLRLIVNEKENDSNYIFYQLDSERVKKSIELRANIAINQASINQKELRKTIIFTPQLLQEQQKIAACLSSIDAWIAAQTEQVAALQCHKKGLLQQLFPAAGETVPRLRFPEFEEAGEWDERTLGEIAVLITEKTRNRKYTLLSVTAGVGLVSQIEKFGKEIAGEAYKNYYVIQKEDFAYNKSSTKQHPEGQIALLETFEQGAVPNSIFTCFRVNKAFVDPSFLKYLFVNNIHGKWLSQFIAVGARANGALQVDNKSLFSLPIPLPTLAEQQKIASCLSALDARIAAETDQLTALKQHKKGLLQQLFPSEGA